MDKLDFEITRQELLDKGSDNIFLIDIRDSMSFEYGHIPGAINIQDVDLIDRNIVKDKEICLYCKSGKNSEEKVLYLREKGFNAYSLKEGYIGWVREHISQIDYEETKKRVEDSIQKRYRSKLFARFVKAIATYDLIQENDKIAVCISGGKDSMLMAKLFQELKVHNKFPFELVFLVMDPGYNDENREIIEKNAKMLGVPITVFETDIFESVFNIEKSPCYICARMRRGCLYSKAKELGCNKIALGHHYDDVIETILMGMLYGAQVQTMMPKVKSTNFDGMSLIRPMYLIREKDILSWRDYNNLKFIQCACKFTDYCTSEGCKSANTGSKRKKVKELIESLAKEDPLIEQHIFKSVENVNLSTVIAYKDKEGKRHWFNDEY